MAHAGGGDIGVNDGETYRSQTSRNTWSNGQPTPSDGAQAQGSWKRGAAASFGGSDDGGSSKKKQKHALSCSECKRRKIKCDRKQPCEACLKRGQPNSCTWEDAKIDPSPQPFALLRDMKALADRLQQVESFLQTLPPDLRRGAPRPQDFSTSYDVDDPLPRIKNQLKADSPAAASPPSRAQTTRATTEDPIGATDGDDPFVGMARPNGAGCEDGDPLLDGHGADLFSLAGAVEMTSASTSIVAEAPKYEDAAEYAGRLGLDFEVTDENLLEVRWYAIERLLKRFPDRALACLLLRTFFDEIDWVHNMINRDSFTAEHETYWRMVESGQQYLVCPLWLALYAMILGLALETVIASGQQSVLNVNNGLLDERYPGLMFAASSRLLELGDWTARPQLRSIWTVMLYGLHRQMLGIGSEMNRFLVKLATVIRLAQIMRLHVLGRNPETMPPPDPALPVAKCSFRREYALRTYAMLVFSDAMSASGTLRGYMLDQKYCTSAPPSNVNISDLSRTDWRIKPKPTSVLTDASFERSKFHMAVQSQMTFDKLVSEQSKFSYNTVIELDEGFRRLLDLIPNEDPITEREKPRLRWKRMVDQESIHARLVRLHRPFATRGFAPGSKFKFSAEKCLESARYVILSASETMKDMDNPWFICSHNLTAAIALFADLFHAIDHGVGEQDLASKRDVLQIALGTFNREYPRQTPTMRSVVARGKYILEGLFRAEEKRRADRAARTLVGSPAHPIAVESFSQVLDRIARQVRNTIASSHKTASPMSSADGGSSYAAHVLPDAAPTPATVLSRPGATDAQADKLLGAFYSDLGLPMSGAPSSEFDLWGANAASKAAAGGDAVAAAAASATGFTPPDLSFLNGGLFADWSGNSMGGIGDNGGAAFYDGRDIAAGDGGASNAQVSHGGAAASSNAAAAANAFMNQLMGW